MSDTAEVPAEHPRREDGTPYPLGGYAFLRLGCRCQGCRDKQSQTGAKGSKAQKAKAKAGSKADRANANLRAVDGAGAGERAAAVVTDLADAARTRTRTPRGGASQEQLEQVTGQLLVYLSIAFVWLAGRDLHLPDEVSDRLALTDEEAADIAAPLSRAFAGTELNSRYGRQVVENADVPVAFFTLAMYVRRVNTTMAQWRHELRRLQAQQPQPTGGPHHVAPQPAAAPQSHGDHGGAEAAEVPPPRFAGAPFTPGDQLRTD